MKIILVFLTCVLFLFNFKNSYSQYTGGAYDGYYSKLDTNIPYPVGIISGEIVLDEFKLYQNYPNPFNPNTVISYQLSVSSFTLLKVYDILGNEIAVLINQKQSAGEYHVEFDGSHLPSGIYFYELKTEKISETKKMLLVK